MRATFTLFLCLLVSLSWSTDQKPQPLDLEASCNLAPKYIQKSMESLQPSQRLAEVVARIHDLFVLKANLNTIEKKNVASKKCEADFDLAIQNHLKSIKDSPTINVYEQKMVEGDYYFAKRDFLRAISVYVEARQLRKKDKDANLKELASIYMHLDSNPKEVANIKTWKIKVKAILADLKSGKDQETKSKITAMSSVWGKAY